MLHIYVSSVFDGENKVPPWKQTSSRETFIGWTSDAVPGLYSKTVKHNFVFEVVWIVHDSTLVSASPHSVLQHLLVDVERRVRAEVVVVLAAIAEVVQHLLTVLIIYEREISEVQEFTYHRTSCP